MTSEERHSGLAGVQSERLSRDTVGNFQLCNLCLADRSHANQTHANKTWSGQRAGSPHTRLQSCGVRLLESAGECWRVPVKIP